MQNANDEALPLLTPTNRTTPSLFYRSLQAIKKTTIYTAGVVSGYMFWPTSFQAAQFGGIALQYIAALGGSITNAIFNIESFLNLSEFPNFRKMPVKYLTAIFVSFFCVLPVFLMNIEDEKGNYRNNTDIALQGFIATLNILVNLVGAIELLDSTSSLCKSKIAQKKSKLMEKIESIFISFSYLNPEEQTTENFLQLIENSFKPLNRKQKITYFSLKTSLGLISSPLILAYTLISYFDMKDFAAKKWDAGVQASILFGIIIAIGNTVPSIGFLIKGLNSSCKKMISIEKPSRLFWVFIWPVSFSGFTTHKAMKDGLKRLKYSGYFAEILKWVANLGAALIYNLPQIAALADRLSKKRNIVPDSFNRFKDSLHEYIQPMDANQLKAFLNDSSSIPSYTSNFFKLTTSNGECSSNNIESQHIIETSFST